MTERLAGTNGTGGNPVREHKTVQVNFVSRGRSGAAARRSPGTAPGGPPPGKADGKSHKRIPCLPSVGDDLFGFRLGQELGRGAFACVFLAEQHDLARRPVVLKISGLDGNEPQTLAQLQQTNIVPIYSVHEDAGRGLRAVCMPYFGGASLSQVLTEVWRGGRPTRGGQLVAALRAVSGPPWGESPSADAEGSPLYALDRVDYFRAAAWVVAQLAEGLQHAHQRGVLHRDVKASNVLLGADGQPMLLDFNMAHQVDETDPELSDFIGGTIAYMAPEHLLALAGHAPAAEVDHRADLYSLGVVFFEMLVGVGPFEEAGAYSPVMPQVVGLAMERAASVPSLRQRRPEAPWALEGILRKCLATEKSRRYQRAEHLAEDLRRFVDDRPLKYAPELSLAERVRKWVRRHPGLTSSASVTLAAALLLGCVGVGLAAVQRHLAQARADLGSARAEEKRRDFEAKSVRALCLVNTTCDLGEGLVGGKLACEEALGLYDVLGREDWQRGPDWRRLSGDDRLRLGESVRELLLLLAWSRVRARPADRACLADALGLLGRAAAVGGLGASRALWEDRARYLRLLGEDKPADEALAAARALEPATARDHYLLATSCARQGRHADAVAHLDRAVRLNPRHYWSVAQRGLCRLELGQTTLAVADFSACVGLWPEFAWGYFNRGYTLEKAGSRAEAVGDYTTALSLDPDFVPAYLNRGLARLELRQYVAALADFDEALRRGRDDAFLHSGRGISLEKLRRFAEADRAFAAAGARAQQLPAEAQDRLRCAFGFAVAARKPDSAGSAFAEVLARSPQHTQALYGRAMVLVEAGREPAAIACFSKALEADPHFADARRYRAILYARAGRFGPASQDINACLAAAGEDGPTLYAAACVTSRLAEKTTGAAAEALAGQGLAFLERALQRGFGADRAAADPDLRSLRGRARFSAALKTPGGRRLRGP
jgi:serine/threonine protein kinase/tetratricopeptide (TPR) repeat protein